MHTISLANRHRLLIVDDDPSICELLKDVGESNEYATIATTEAKEFQILYSEFEPTMIILDLSIGERDGIELLRFLSGKSCKSPIIMMSGHDERVRATAFRLGSEYGLNMATHLQKPINVDMVITLLEKHKTKQPFINAERLEQAIKEFELVNHYQPIISFKTHQVLGAEALVRWQPKDQPMIFPDAFIPLAEQTGIIEPLTVWAIDQACKQLHAWSEHNIPLSIQINLSARLLNNLSFPDEIMAISKKYKIAANKICFEVTESGIMSQSKVAMDILTRLRVKGFSLSLDDFGIGYSSLVALHRMPFKEIKIDKSFVLNMSTDHECVEIIKAIVQLGHSLKLDIVAEGIETKDNWDKLSKMGCDIAQGYYISKPLAADDFNVWLKTHTDSEFKWKQKFT